MFKNCDKTILNQNMTNLHWLLLLPLMPSLLLLLFVTLYLRFCSRQWRLVIQPVTLAWCSTVSWLCQHKSSLCWSAYNYIRQLRAVVRVLSVVHAFLSSRLDYCNSLLFGVADSLVQRLEAVQNAAARFVSGTRRCEHITPVLRRLHWLYQYGNVLNLRWPFWCI